MLNKVVFQKDHYSAELLLECKNCEIIPDPESSEWVFVKVTDEVLNNFSEIKRDILIIINRNPELYCDCKKFIKVKRMCWNLKFFRIYRLIPGNFFINKI